VNRYAPCSEDGGRKPEPIVRDDTSDRNRSESEPIEVIFRKIAQKEQPVPRSVERGATYDAMHDPAPSRRTSSTAAEAPVVLNVTTEPRVDGAAPVERLPFGGARVVFVLTMLLLVLVLVIAVGMSMPTLIF
jgi:hypothetical protein